MINQEKTISFDELKFKQKHMYSDNKSDFNGKIIRFLINKHIVKNEQQAQSLIIFIIIISMILSLFLFNNSIEIEPAVIDPSLFR